MSDNLKEIVLMLDSFFKGLTEVGLILNYNVQIQKIALDDDEITSKIKDTILVLIRRLKKIYTTLSHCDNNGNKDVSKCNIIDVCSEEKVLEQDNNSKSSTNEQATRDIVVAYNPFSLASTVNKTFLAGSSMVSKESNQNCSNSSSVETRSLIAENQTFPGKLSTLLDFDKTETDTERGDTINTIEVFNVDSIIISEDSLRNWNALQSTNNFVETNIKNNQNYPGQTVKGLSSNSTVTSKTNNNLVEANEQENYECDLQLLRQNIATVLVVKSVDMPEDDQASDKESLKHSSVQNVQFQKITYTDECSCDDLTQEENISEQNQCMCLKCKKTFESIEELEEHCNVLHRGYGDFECCTCNYRFLTSRELVKHVRKHGNQFKCSDCDKSFATKLGLTRHINSHEKKEFACDICGKTFSRADYLPVHKAAHAGKMIYPCKSCPKKFRYKNQLSVHQKIHSGVKDYVCKICSKGFSRNDKLKEHLLRHYNIRRFQCNVCPKSFAEKRDLNTHMKTHHNNRNSKK